ncbi:DUF1772 domain-containing protein [Actinoplanes sp. NBC_00393]|uniref:anthrone oxygenase family protein n=1 Tax=Actinoplanes sp. NBC_00393 TaxID=2975953 RepID=UPI002E1B0CF0
MRTTILLLAVLMLGLMAGLFYAYSGSVMLGLRAAGDRAAVEVMQRINVAIQNPLFGVIFIGALVFTAIAAFQNSGTSAVFIPLMIALLLYAATLLVTFVVNIPLNNRLNEAGDPHEIENPTAVWAAFLPRWLPWNHLRTLTSTGAFAAACWALLQY